MINEAPNTKLMEENVLAERQGVADEVGAALAQGMVEALDMSSFPGLLAKRALARGGQDRVIGGSEIGITQGALAVVWGQGCP